MDRDNQVKGLKCSCVWSSQKKGHKHFHSKSEDKRDMMESDIGAVSQVPTDEIITKAEIPGNHALGLQDLYKAAFSQEPTDGFAEFSKDPTVESQLITDPTDNIYDGKLESTVDKTEIIYKGENLDQAYHLYSLKNMNYVDEFKKPEDGKDYTEEGVKISEETAPIIMERPFDTFQTIDTNSVLDLDKGVQIQVIKVSDAEDGTSNLGFFQNREYTGDAGILQRYLNDAGFLKDGEITPQTTTTTTVPLNCDKSYLDDRGVGVSPEALGIRFEDCEFNSSDSFASTESIIPKNIKCPKCPKKFMFKSDLLRHDKYKHSVKPKLSCKFCNKEFASQQNLVFHEKSHKKRVANKCETCKKVFKKNGFLVKHMMKKHSKSSSFACGQCDKVFTTQVLLTNHTKKAHSPDSVKPFKCDKCSKSFEKKQGLTCHVKAHTDDQVYTCPTCSKVFTKICYLKNHQKCHTNQEKERHVCDTCGKAFKSSSALEMHSRRHTGEKPFTCNVCLKSFACKAYFNVHIKKHSEIKPFSCSYCQKAFVTSADLNKHERTHTKEKPFQCTNCNQEFSQQSNLITHWKKQRCNGSKTQEVCVQTQEVELVDPNLQTLQNVNLLVDQSVFGQQPIVLTSIGSFLNSNAVPVILTQTPAVPYSLSSITS